MVYRWKLLLVALLSFYFVTWVSNNEIYYIEEADITRL
jgi:hypothetical protein